MMYRPRIVVAFVVSLFLTASLLWAGGQEEAATVDEDAVTVEMWAIRELPEEFYQRFSEEHPEINLQVEEFSREDIRGVLSPALQSGDGPDLFSFTPGPGFGGALARAGLVRPLEEYYESLGWYDKFYEWTYERETYDGTLYGIGDEPEILGVFYHMDIFEELGLDVPKTVRELFEVSETLKEAGYIPMSFGNRAGWPAYHNFSMVANNMAGLDVMDDVLFEGGSWDRREFVDAVQLAFVDMVDAGMFPDGINAVSYDEANMLFYTKESAMNITGMWLLEQIINTVEDPESIGFFPFPAIEDGGPILPPGIGTSYYISAGSEHPDEAAKVLDFLFSDEMAHFRAEADFFLPPFALDLDRLDMPGLALQLIEQVQIASVDPDEPVGYNIDVLTGPQFNEIMAEGFQAVIGGDRTPAEQIREMQRAWEAEQ